MAVTSTLGHYPKFTVTVGTGGGARTPTVEGLKFSSVVNGGHDRLEGFISDAERSTGGANYNAWTPMQVALATGETGSGSVVWDGYVARKVTTSSSGKCALHGVGAAEIARTTYKTRLYRTDEYAAWGSRDGEDFGINGNYRHIDAEVDDRILFKANTGAYGVGNAGGVAILVEEAKARKITFVNGKSADHPFFSLRVRSFTAPLPGLNEANMTQLGNLISLGPGGPAQGFTSVRTCPVGQEKNAINIDLYCDTKVTLSESGAFQTGINTVRVYDVANTDSYFASNVVTDVGTVCGYDTTLVTATTTPVLPLFWKRSAPLSDLLDLMCDADQMLWRVKNRSSGAYQIEFIPWTHANSINWFVSASDPAVGKVDIEASDDLINQVRVFYYGLGGRRKHVTANADGLAGRPTDPFTGTVRAYNNKPMMLDYDISDRQPSTAYPLAVANALVKEYAVQQYEGTVELASAHQGSIGGTERFAPIIMAGDRLTLGTTTYRVYEAEHSESGPTRLTIGRRPGTFQALVAKHLKLLERKGQ